MKKLLLVALAVLMTTMSFAQFRMQPQSREAAMPKATNDVPSWIQISSAPIFTDINGNQVDVGGLLMQGQYVLIDISCTWCAPCWNMHSTGILEAIDAMSNVTVLWVESDPSTTLADIRGTGSNTQGNWTVDSHGNPITYPIIEDDNGAAEAMIGSIYRGYVPTIALISPSGYACDMYGTSWGFNSSTAPANAVTIVSNVIAMAPAAGQPPIAQINGMNAVLKNSQASFTVDYVSVDAVTSITWDFADGTPATATGNNVTTSWSTTGNRTISCIVTNANGSDTATLDVNVFEWNWGDEMSYCGTNPCTKNIGGVSPMIWAVKFPATLMTNRNYLTNVAIYDKAAGLYDISVFQTNEGQEPNMNGTPLFTTTASFTGSENFVNVPTYGISIDDSKDMWVIVSTEASYPAAACDFVGDLNGSYVYLNGQWMHIQDASATLNCTWMIKATTSADAPALSCGISAPASAFAGSAVTLTAQGPADATYTWTLNGATPATATGNTVSVTYAAGGSYTIALTATRDSETANATATINIIECNPVNLPFTCGFEASDDMGCWNFIDADGDGYNWDMETWAGSNYVHGGSNAIGTASFINNIGILTPDQWMVTPELVIPSNGATLTYWVGGVSEMYGDKYSVYVSTTGADPSNFTNDPVLTETPDNASFTKKTVSLGAYAGQTIRLGFRHYASQDGYWLIFDDLQVAAGANSINDVELTNISLYPNPTTGMLRVNAENIQEVSVMDINGRVIMTQVANTIDMTNLANGVYFVRVITNEGTATQKVVKK